MFLVFKKQNKELGKYYWIGISKKFGKFAEIR